MLTPHAPRFYGMFTHPNNTLLHHVYTTLHTCRTPTQPADIHAKVPNNPPLLPQLYLQLQLLYTYSYT